MKHKLFRIKIKFQRGKVFQGTNLKIWQSNKLIYKGFKNMLGKLKTKLSWTMRKKIKITQDTKFQNLKTKLKIM